jgi:hypothetical protein
MTTGNTSENESSNRLVSALARHLPRRFVASKTLVPLDLFRGTEQIWWLYVLCYDDSANTVGRYSGDELRDRLNA